MTDKIEAALKRAYSLGQLYWQQADSDSFSQHKKTDETRAKFDALVHETLTLLHEAAQPVSEGCTPADARVLREANHALAEEVAQYKADAERWRQWVSLQSGDVMSLVRDAERYRAWRRAAAAEDYSFIDAAIATIPDTSGGYIPSESEIDAGFDAALAAQKGGQK